MPRPRKSSSEPAPPPPTSEPELVAEVRQLRADVRTLLDIVAPIVTRRITVAQRAKLSGISRITDWRRRRRAKLHLALQPYTRRTP